MAIEVSDQELLAMQERAWRVAENPRASGSARRLASDLLRVTILIQKKRTGRGAKRARKLAIDREIERLNRLFDLPSAE